MIDDSALVAPVSITGYVRAGQLTRARARWVGMLRLLRLPVSFGVTGFPVLLLSALVLAASDASFAETSVSRTRQWTDALANAPGLGPSVFVLTLGGLVFGCGGLAVLDATIWGRLRDAASSRRRSAAAAARESGAGFFGLTLIRFAMYSATLMFLSPLLRVGIQIAQERLTQGAAAALVVVLGGIVAIALAALRFVLAVCGAWMTWRPRFFLGALVAGLTAPYRRPELYGAVALRWLPAYFVELISAVAVILLGVAPSTVPALRDNPILLFAVVVAFTSSRRVGLWLDATLVAVVGHQLGELDLAEVARQKTVMPSSNKSAASTQPRFEPPVRGLYVPTAPGSQAPRSIVTFEQLLGHPAASGLARIWSPSSALLDVEQDAQATQGGALELRLRAAVEAPSPIGVASAERASTARNAPAVPSAGPATPEELDAQLDRAVVRTAGGAAELRWRPQR